MFFVCLFFVCFFHCACDLSFLFLKKKRIKAKRKTLITDPKSVCFMNSFGEKQDILVIRDIFVHLFATKYSIRYRVLLCSEHNYASLIFV